MKLTVKVTMEDGSANTKEIDIKNPKATVANMRAAICIIMKLGDVSAFRFSSPDADLSANNDGVKLSDTELKEGSIVLARSKRGRDGEEESPEEATVIKANDKTTSSVAEENKDDAKPKEVALAPVAAVEKVFATAEKIKSLTDMGFSEPQAKMALQRTSGNEQRAIEMVLAGHVSETGALQGSAAPASEGSAAPRGNLQIPEDLLQQLVEQGGLEMGEDDEEFEDDEEDDDFLDGDFEEDEETEEDAERSQLAMGLMAMGNPNELSQQFLANPQEMLARIQRDQPELFALIGRHNQFFIDLVNTGAELTGEDLREDGEGSSDEDEEADDSNVDVAALAAAAAQVMGRRRAQGGDVAAPPAPLTEKDNENIEGLTQLGFSKDQCTAAYLRCGRNPERAANHLFENPQ